MTLTEIAESHGFHYSQEREGRAIWYVFHKGWVLLSFTRSGEGTWRAELLPHTRLTIGGAKLGRLSPREDDRESFAAALIRLFPDRDAVGDAIEAELGKRSRGKLLHPKGGHRDWCATRLRAFQRARRRWADED